MKNKQKLVAVASAATFVLTGCGTDPVEQQSVSGSTLAELYEAAKSEGQVQIYGPTEDLYKDVYADFAQTYPGIKVTTADIFGQELDARLEGEIAAGGFKADLVHIGVSDVERYAEKEYLTSYEVVEIGGVDAKFIGKDNLWSVPSRHLYAPIYNTTKVQSNQVPKTWADVVDGRLPGMVAVSNPKVSGATPQTLAAALKAGVVDEAWLTKFKDSAKPRIYPSVATALQSTVTGEVAMSLVAGYGTYMRQVKQGAKIKMAPLSDGAYMSDVAYAVLDENPHPNAARLLVAWMFTDEGQASIAKHVFEFGTVEGAPEPEGAEELGDFKEIDYPGVDDYKRTLALLNQKF